MSATPTPHPRQLVLRWALVIALGIVALNVVVFLWAKSVDAHLPAAPPPALSLPAPGGAR